MFFKNKQIDLETRIYRLEDCLRGIEVSGNSFDNPANYSVLGKIDALHEDYSRNGKILFLLLEKLGYKLEEGQRIVKKK